MVSTIYQKDSYINKEIDFLLSHFIREYDIRKANISILLSKGLITQQEFDYYASLGDMRSIVIGKLQKKNEKIKEALTNGFYEYRQMFFEANNIQDNDVLAVKKDAIYLIDKEATYQTFDYVNFINKNTYTSYYSYGRYEMYYGINRITGDEKLDVKGMKSSYPLHNGYMNDLLMCIFECAEVDILEAINILTTFLNNYMKREVEIQYYREYNDYSMYRLFYNGCMSYTLDNVSERDKFMLDISYNRKLIENILSYFYRIIKSRVT